MRLYRAIPCDTSRTTFSCPGPRSVANEIRHLSFATAIGLCRLCLIYAVVDGDDRRTDIDRVALANQQFSHSAGVRCRKLDQRFAGLDLDKDVVDLDLVTDRNPPRNNVCLDQSLARIR